MSQRTTDELNAEHLNPWQYPYCPHGSRLWRSFLQPGIPWNGPVGRCSCCFSVFGYIDEGSFGVDADGKLQRARTKLGQVKVMKP